VDQARHFAKESRGIGINLRTLQILEACEAAERLLDEGTRIERSNLPFPGNRVATIEFQRLDGTEAEDHQRYRGPLHYGALLSTTALVGPG